MVWFVFALVPLLFCEVLSVSVDVAAFFLSQSIFPLSFFSGTSAKVCGNLRQQLVA
jgi:hypothetical protein